MRWLVIAVIVAGCGSSGKKTIDAAPTTDAGPTDGHPNGTDAAILVGPACGATTCTNGQQDCCIGVMSACKPTGTCPSQGFACDGPEDCPGAQCCYGNGGQGGSTCKATCSTIACHHDTDCPPATSKCCPKAFTPDYGVCQTAC
jgi:hypothetical protein